MANGRCSLATVLMLIAMSPASISLSQGVAADSPVPSSAAGASAPEGGDPQLPVGAPVEPSAAPIESPPESAAPPSGQGEVTASTPAAVAAPVNFAGRVIFELHEGIGSFSPADRAAAIEKRIERIARDPLEGEARLVVSEFEYGATISFEDQVLVAVSVADARHEGITPHLLAERWATAIGEAIAVGHRTFSLRALVIGAVLTLLATVVLFTLLRLLSRGVPVLAKRIREWRGTVIPSIRIQSFEIVSARRIASALVTLVRVSRVIAVVVALIVYLQLVLGFFPWTRSLALAVTGYALQPLGAAWVAFVGFLPNLFFLIVIGFVTYYGIGLVRAIFDEIEQGSISFPGFDREWVKPTYKIVRLLILVFAVIVAFPYLPGSSSPAFKGISLFLGLLLSLGSSSAIANIVAGVILTYTRAFRIGDRVQIADTVGDVLEKTLLVTRVRTVKNVEITVPNSMVLASHIVNYSAAAGTHGLFLHTRVTIGYDVPWRTVHELLIGAARRTDGLLAEPEPFVLQLSLDDHYPTYELNAVTRDPNRMSRIYSDLHANIQDAFNDAGVEIMSPAYTALRDGNATTVPEAHRPPGYDAPGFRVTSLVQKKP